uniref:non-specific serine/threonine protein kinase n=1 Tax=Lactuca sativa TaxID=4236 RepID=A0A9R1V8B5_LACSA|nr:hypothetical protein LSAT_V11C600299710 [Lactuca sativa]
MPNTLVNKDLYQFVTKLINAFTYASCKSNVSAAYFLWQDNFERGTPVEFRNEIQTLSKIEHLNLVRFYGYIEHGEDHMILVEYVANGTLREHLDGKCGSGLEIGERLDIMIDVAHAITYLHTYTDLPIIHRDIKSSNILITDKLRAKVADFVFARISVEDPRATHISTQVKGTAGYLDPEYLSTYQLTDRSDVYSFGVLLVDMVTGRLPIEINKAPNEKLTTKWFSVAETKRRGGGVGDGSKAKEESGSSDGGGEGAETGQTDYHEYSEVMEAANHSVQVPPQMAARKNRIEFFGIEESTNQRFQSA